MDYLWLFLPSAFVIQCFIPMTCNTYSRTLIYTRLRFTVYSIYWHRYSMYSACHVSMCYYFITREGRTWAFYHLLIQRLSHEPIKTEVSVQDAVRKSCLILLIWHNDMVKWPPAKVMWLHDNRVHIQRTVCSST